MTQREKIILVSGEFNIITPKEIKFLKRCRSKGNWLIVGIHSDTSMYAKYGFIENESSIYGLIKETRLKNNISMEELAERLSVTKQAVMDMEKRDAQGRVTIGLLSRYLSAMDYKLQTRAIPIVK